MRAALRPLIVGLAVVGLAAAGASAAQASGDHHKPSSKTSTSWVIDWTDKSLDINRSIVFGPMMNGDTDINVGNKVLADD